MREKPRRMSLELERALLYRPGMRWYPPLAAPYGPATPPSLQQVLRDLAGGGWKVLKDPCTGVLTRVAKPYPGGGDAQGEWTCTSDVTTGIFETTLSPSHSVLQLDQQQSDLDAEVAPALAHSGLFLMNFETQPGIVPTREHYALFHSYWKGEYGLRRQRGEDHYWFSWTIGNSPCLDVTVEEAIPFLRVIHRLTGVTFFFRRLGSISGGQPRADGRLAIRPWALGNLWRRSPYPSDSGRVRLPDPEIASWRDYFAFIGGLRLTLLVGEDQQPWRVQGDPTFLELWRGQAGQNDGWLVTSADGQTGRLSRPTLAHLSAIQRQVYFSRLRWSFDPSANLTEFGEAFDAGETALQSYLNAHLVKLYLEVRSDSCPPPHEECATLAFYLGLLENLAPTVDYVIDRHSRAFWQRCYIRSEFDRVDSAIDGEWLPDVLHALLDLAYVGLTRRGLGEERCLQPLRKRVDRLTTPADEAIDVFRRAGGGVAGLTALAEYYSIIHDGRSPYCGPVTHRQLFSD